MGTLTKILLGIILTLVIGISIYVPITNSHLTRLNKEMVAKDTVISQMENVNKQLTDRLTLVQNLNTTYDNTISNVQLSTEKYQNAEVQFSTPTTIEQNPTATIQNVNTQISNIFNELELLDRPPVITKGDKK